MPKTKKTSKTTCRYKTKSGVCGNKTDNSWKCKEHKKLKCSNCKKSAYIDCPWPQCSKQFCRDPACLKKHIEDAHDGNWPKIKHARRGQREAREKNANAAPCPYCEQVADIVTWYPGEDSGKASHSYVECTNCKMRGPEKRTPEDAVTQWNSLPRSRPLVYERIRNNALEFLDRELQFYIDNVETGQATVDDLDAVAKALESATVAVDTWG